MTNLAVIWEIKDPMRKGNLDVGGLDAELCVFPLDKTSLDEHIAERRQIYTKKGATVVGVKEISYSDPMGYIIDLINRHHIRYSHRAADGNEGFMMLGQNKAKEIVEGEGFVPVGVYDPSKTITPFSHP